MKLRTILSSGPPRDAVSIAPDGVQAIHVTHGPHGPIVTAHAAEPLPPKAVDPVLNGPNIADRAAVTAALGRVFARLGHRPRRVALTLPDTVGKVSLVRFEKLPGRAEDLEQMIRFQVRKTAPFPIEDAQISHVRGATLDGGGREFLVVLARRDVVEEYEKVCEAAGASAGIVDLASLNVVNAVLARPSRPTGDWLLVHVTPHCATMIILRGSDLIFYRSRGEEPEGTLSGLVHQTAMYYEDRLGGQGFSKVVLVGGAAAYAGMESGDWLRRNLEERLHTSVAVLDRDAVKFGDRVTADVALVDRYSPLVGVLERAG